jgi:hypothetical protein
MIDVELPVVSPVAREQVEAARRRIASLDRYLRDPVVGARPTRRRDGSPRSRRWYVADADVRFDGRLLVAHAAGRTVVEAALAPAEPIRYSEPLPFATARAEKDLTNHRWTCFPDAGDGRGKILCLRLDGDYGLVEPAP